ncbi:hypothetical protein OG216_09890 [Streptomycetaceae bacterium NBC_01309]
MTTVLLVLVIALQVALLVVRTLQRRTDNRIQRTLDAHTEAITAINQIIGIHQRTLDTLRGIRR